MLSLPRFRVFHSFNEVFIALVYFVQGSGGLTSIALTLLLRETFGLSFTEVAMVGALSILPWTAKPALGLLSDMLPIGGFFRKPYLHLAPLIAACGFVSAGLCAASESYLGFVVSLIAANTGLALTDATTDGLVVEQSTTHSAARLQGITQSGIRVAAFLSSFFSGLLIYRDIFSISEMFFLAGALPFLVFAASFFVREAPHKKAPTKTKAISPALLFTLFPVVALLIFSTLFGSSVATALSVPSFVISGFSAGVFSLWFVCYFLRQIRVGLAVPAIFIALAFILLWRINPGVGAPLFFWVRDELGVTEELLGFAASTGHLTSLIAILAAVYFAQRFSLRTWLTATVIASGLFGISAFLFTRPDALISIASSPLFIFCATIISLPVLFFQSVIEFFFTGTFQSPLSLAESLSPAARFVFVQGALDDFLFMLAFIPLLKFAVLITPKVAAATNFSVITAIMNIGLALSAWLSGVLYDVFKNPLLPEAAIDAGAIDVLIGINILTSFMCLLVLPFLRRTPALK